MLSAVISPHLDDAVLSCWHVLEGGGETTVVNVFTGSPAAGTPAPAWDRLTGASDPVVRMRERRAEDRRALALAGCAALQLGLLDDQYRDSTLSAAWLADAIEAAIAPGALVHVPAAMGGHPDHVLARDAGLELARRGWSLVIYADIPHAIPRGWPGWVTGIPESNGGDVGAAWDEILAAAGLRVQRLVARVRALDEEARTRKLRALAEYRTQRAALDDMTFAPLEDPRALAFEVSWQVPLSALRAVGEPLRDRG